MKTPAPKIARAVATPEGVHLYAAGGGRHTQIRYGRPASGLRCAVSDIRCFMPDPEPWPVKPRHAARLWQNTVLPPAFVLKSA